MGPGGDTVQDDDPRAEDGDGQLDTVSHPLMNHRAALSLTGGFLFSAQSRGT